MTDNDKQVAYGIIQDAIQWKWTWFKLADHIVMNGWPEDLELIAEAIGLELKRLVPAYDWIQDTNKNSRAWCRPWQWCPLKAVNFIEDFCQETSKNLNETLNNEMLMATIEREKRDAEAAEFKKEFYKRKARDKELYNLYLAGKNK